MKKIARLLAMGICVLLVTLLLRGYTAAFTAAHFPDTQPGTYWTDEDGILTVRVSDEPVQSSRAVKRYACQVSVCWNGERYAASFGQNPCAARPHAGGRERNGRAGLRVERLHAELPYAPA